MVFFLCFIIFCLFVAGLFGFSVFFPLFQSWDFFFFLKIDAKKSFFWLDFGFLWMKFFTFVPKFSILEKKSERCHERERSRKNCKLWREKCYVFLFWRGHFHFSEVFCIDFIFENNFHTKIFFEKKAFFSKFWNVYQVKISLIFELILFRLGSFSVWILFFAL